MDERELRSYHRAAQPILQRTAPIPAQSRIKITPTVLDEIAWGVVLAYVANTAHPAPNAIPSQVRNGEGPLPDEEVQAALATLKSSAIKPRLQPRGPGLERFSAAVRRLLDAYGWAPSRAEQAAEELAAALRTAWR